MKMSVVTILLLACSLAIAQSFPKHTLAVLEFQSNGYSQSIARSFTDSLFAVISRTDSFIVLDNSSRKVLLELKGLGNLNNASDSVGFVAVGSVLPVDKIIGGEISKYGDISSIRLLLFDVKCGAMEATALRHYKGSVEFFAERAVTETTNELIGILPLQVGIETQPPANPEIVARYQREKKQWVTASLLSCLWPGAGHFYTGENLLGATLAISGPIVVLAMLSTGSNSNMTDAEIRRVDFLAGAFITVHIVDIVAMAPYCAHRYNQRLKRKYGLSFDIQPRRDGIFTALSMEF